VESVEAAVAAGKTPEVGRAQIHLRYEDLTQDGHLKITRMLHAVGSAAFAQLWIKHPLIQTMQQGILPILSRLLMTTEPNPVMLGPTLDAEGRFQLAHEADASGEVKALLLNMSAEVFGIKGRSYGAPPEGAGQRVCVGRAVAEHVFTRPFAPPNERKVLRFELPGQPSVPEARHVRRLVADVLAGAPGDAWLDPALAPDPAPWVFGMVHTDNNQHVNSLVYGTLFEDAVLRRLSDHGIDTRLHAASLELVYRKPCFAGQRVVCQLRAFRNGEHVGAIGYVAPAGAAPDKACCAMRLELRKAQALGAANIAT
jgi:hypothetical protein